MSLTFDEFMDLTYNTKLRFSRGNVKLQDGVVYPQDGEIFQVKYVHIGMGTKPYVIINFNGRDAKFLKERFSLYKLPKNYLGKQSEYSITEKEKG